MVVFRQVGISIYCSGSPGFDININIVENCCLELKFDS